MRWISRGSKLTWLTLSLMVTACGGARSTPTAVATVHVDQPAPAPDNWPPRPTVIEPITGQFPNVASGHVGTSSVQLLSVTDKTQPLVHLRWVIRGGRALQWSAKGARWPEGAVDLAALLAQQGTRKHPDTQLPVALGNLGAHLQIAVLGDALLVEGIVPSHNLEPYLGLLREVLAEPTLDKAALERLRAEQRARLQDELNVAPIRAANLAQRLVFGVQHAYGSTGPTLATLPTISLQHVKQAWSAATKLGGSTLVAVGDVDPAQLGPLVDRIFGGALATASEAVDVPLPQAATTDTCHVINLPKAAQAEVVEVVAAPPRKTSTWSQLAVVNQIFGGSASSRLFRELRDKQGLTYGAYSGFEGRRRAGRWTLQASIRAEATAQAFRTIDDLLLQTRRQEPTAGELADARRFLAGQHALLLGSPEHVADLVAALPLYDLSTDYWQGWVDRLQQVTSEQALESAVQSWPMTGRIVVVAGPLDKMRPGLDATCNRLILHDDSGKKPRTLIGPDAEMTADWPTDLQLWARGGDGTLAAARFAKDASHAQTLRAAALVAIVRGPDASKTLELGRMSTDWRDKLAPELAKQLVDLLGHADAAVEQQAHTVLLAMATGHAGQPADLTPDQSSTVVAAVAEWAFAGISDLTPADTIRQIAQKRLQAGDLAILASADAAPLEHWIAADALRLEAARALAAAGARAHTSLVRGYRRWVAQGGVPTAADLQILGGLQAIDALVLLLDVHAASLRDAKLPTTPAQTAATMATIRTLVDKLGKQRDADGKSTLLAQFTRVEAHLENLLTLPNADDRWYAARLLVHHRGVAGLRFVMNNLAIDDHYSSAAWHTLDPKRAVAELARDEVTPLGADVIPVLLAGLAGRNPVGKVVAVAGLKAHGTDGALQALATCTDESDVATYLALPSAFTVRDQALAAMDVHKFYGETSALVAQGKLSVGMAAIYRELAYGTTDLSGRKLRTEVLRMAAERNSADSPPAQKGPAVSDLP